MRCRCAPGTRWPFVVVTGHPDGEYFACPHCFKDLSDEDVEATRRASWPWRIYRARVIAGLASSLTGSALFFGILAYRLFVRPDWTGPEMFWATMPAIPLALLLAMGGVLLGGERR